MRRQQLTGAGAVAAEEANAGPEFLQRWVSHEAQRAEMCRY